MQVRFLLITGPKVADARLDFGPGLNVIYGGSNTGKTHIVRLLDFALGASQVPEPVAEQAGYDLVHLGISFPDGSEITIVRALQGGDAKVLDGLVSKRPAINEGENLSAKHSAKASLSKFLLSKLNLGGSRIRKNAKGETRDLSFRDLSRHVLINETKIQSVESPIQFGQYMDRTLELSTFKILVTGVDDSALDVTKKPVEAATRRAAQLELLDRMLREVNREIEIADQDFEDLRRRESLVDGELELHLSVQESAEAPYRALSQQRRAVVDRREALIDRCEEINVLLTRFDLLSQHYESDLARLEAIQEAGQLLDLEPDARCPLCGAEPDHRQAEFSCEGDTSDIIAAAGAQIVTVKRRAGGLQETRTALTDEYSKHQDELPNLESLSAQLSREITTTVPVVREVRSYTNSLVQQKISLNSSLDLVRRKERLEEQRRSLGFGTQDDSITVIAQQNLDGTTLDSFCQVIEQELKSWDFPSADRVFFDLSRRDISVGGKARAANGKGVRSLLHAAFSIALMKFSAARQHGHPGFLVLDSLFITYRDPDDLDEAALAKSPLKDRAFQAFQSLPHELQLIVLENVDVPEWLAGSPQCLNFTGNSATGRPGLFPVKN